MGHVRPATPRDIPAIARIHVDAWRAAYRGVVPDAYLDALSVAGRAQRLAGSGLAYPRGAGFTLVAERAGQVVGFASGGPSRDVTIPFEGELYAIYLRPGNERRGVGRALMRAVVDGLAAQGHRSMYAFVLVGNARARAFYAALGGESIVRKTIEVGGAQLMEVAYGWRRLPDVDATDSR